MSVCTPSRRACRARSSGSERLPAMMPSVCNDGAGTGLDRKVGLAKHHPIERKTPPIVNLKRILAGTARGPEMDRTCAFQERPTQFGIAMRRAKMNTERRDVA